MRKQRAAAILAIAVSSIAIGGVVQSTTSDAASATTRAVARSHGGYITTVTSAAGTVKVFDLRSAATVSQTAPRTAKVASGSGTRTVVEHDLDVTPTTTTVNKATFPAVANLSDAAMLQAMGAPAAVVQQFATHDATLGSTTTVATAAGVKRAAVIQAVGYQAETAAVMTAATTNPGQLYDRTCLTGTYTHGGAYGCFDQYIASRGSGSDWTMGDSFYGSATMHDTAIINPDELTGLRMGVVYVTGNTIYNWSPRSTLEGGSCVTKTFTVGAFSSTYSQSSQSCPEVYGLYSITAHQFYTKWDGQGSGPHNGARDTAGVDTVHNGANYAPTRTVHMSWWTD